MLKAIGLLLIVLVVAGVGYLWLSGPFAMDSCLDGGGVWDYAKRACHTNDR